MDKVRLFKTILELGQAIKEFSDERRRADGPTPPAQEPGPPAPAAPLAAEPPAEQGTGQPTDVVEKLRNIRLR